MRIIKTVAMLVAVLACIQTANADWIKRNTKSFAWFKDIQFVNDRVGWIAGTDGVLLSTNDGGTTWVQTKKFTNDTILQVHFTDEENGWLLCERNVYERGNFATSYLRKTIDGGISWEKIEFMDGGRERVTKLMFGANGDGTAFGEAGIFYKLQDDGRSWKKSRTAIHYLLLDGGFSNEKFGALVGAGGTILFTEDGGFTWERSTLLPNSDVKFNSVFFANPKAAWAVGTEGRIFFSSGGGRLWKQQDSTVTANLNDVFFTNASNGWAVGDNGIIVHTRNAGQTWDDVDSHVPHKLEKVVFVGNTGWAVGFGGTVLTYEEGVKANPETTGPPTLQRRG